MAGGQRQFQIYLKELFESKVCLSLKTILGLVAMLSCHHLLFVCDYPGARGTV